MNPLSILWVQYINISFTFAWSFIDLFIMIMSMSIATKFKMINERLELFKGRILSDAFWDEIRRHYNKVCELNDYVLDLIGCLICLACLGDLYSICMQLLNVTKPLPYQANKIYFWFSTIFLICRTFTMFLITASVNEESVKPLVVFRTIPKYGWLPQVERLCSQVQQNHTALGARNFFSLTRKMIFTIAGTIVTYELVLLQFYGQNDPPKNFDVCNGINRHSASPIST
ncbi:gustatory receptor for sugar taste 64f-like [Chironomus tepperi]|uniref:gustatory receptor for sugar taste 64f-like n=1 Tax=Chironomus tepperi TaxID=113505 RepID=UPI00391FAD53